MIRDDDKQPTKTIESGFISKGGKVVAWASGRALEDELFSSLSADAVDSLISLAIQIHGTDLIDEHIKTASQNQTNLSNIQTEYFLGEISEGSRGILGRASRTKSNSWFKTVSRMEDIARDIVGPDLKEADTDFKRLVDGIFDWTADAGE